MRTKKPYLTHRSFIQTVLGFDLNTHVRNLVRKKVHVSRYVKLSKRESIDEVHWAALGYCRECANRNVDRAIVENKGRVSARALCSGTFPIFLKAAVTYVVLQQQCAIPSVVRDSSPPSNVFNV